MRRWSLLLAGAGLWLFLAAIPALADGGPHVAANNSGVSTLTADGCAGCHRAHTAQGPLLLAAPDEEALCLSCHGATGTGASTNVELGVQYTSANDGTPADNAVLGALRGGGFVEARLDTANPTRVAYMRDASNVSFRTKVPVKTTGQAVTSAHLKLVGATGVVSTGKAWGNGALNSGAGPTLDMGCATCHNPHGNGSYRILNPIPSLTATAGTFTAVTAPGVVVSDAPDPTNATRNYTVIQTKGTQGTDSSYLLLASQVVSGGYSNTAGDYFHRNVPWDTLGSTYTFPSTGGGVNDAPNGRPASGTFSGTVEVAFNFQINAWCAACHTRYATIDASGTTTVVGTSDAPGFGPGSFDVNSGDAIFKYRHSNSSNKPCTTCHVAHGSNAQMTGDFSKAFPYPDGTTAASSRLLKIDNRGTCEACHDPTNTVVAGASYGPVPAPYTP